jgi:hypothetical protein
VYSLYTAVASSLSLGSLSLLSLRLTPFAIASVINWVEEVDQEVLFASLLRNVDSSVYTTETIVNNTFKMLDLVNISNPTHPLVPCLPVAFDFSSPYFKCCSHGGSSVPSGPRLLPPTSVDSI